MMKKIFVFPTQASRLFFSNIFLFVLFASFLFASCVKKEENYTPKPKGYFRIQLPGHEYQTLDTALFPYSFSYSKHAIWVQDERDKDNQKKWINIQYPDLGATLHLTYFPVKDDLRELVIAEEKMVEFHFKKADNVEYSIVNDPTAKVYGKIYDIQGKGVACPLQFWLTDSTKNYLRASLYFNCTPNNDSLQPVIEYLREDVLKMVNTFKWK